MRGGVIVAATVRVCVIVWLGCFLGPAFASKGFIRVSVDLGVKAKTRPQERVR